MSPMAAARFCAQALCPNRATYRGRCPQHATQKEQTRYNAATRKWYSTEDWRILRLTVLAEQPVCMDCKVAPSVEVDHIVPHRGDYVLFWDRDNLQGLCKQCHGRKTKKGE
jgi:5-methylcytosine-specific restriction protein A